VRQRDKVTAFCGDFPAGKLLFAVKSNTVDFSLLPAQRPEFPALTRQSVIVVR
jgi:hypothetical protein